MLTRALPFQGGNSWKDVAAFYRELYAIGSSEASGQKVAEVIAAQPLDHAVVVVAHNGRSELGRTRTDICGVDWRIGAGKPLWSVQRIMLKHSGRPDRGAAPLLG